MLFLKTYCELLDANIDNLSGKLQIFWDNESSNKLESYLLLFENNISINKFLSICLVKYCFIKNKQKSLC